MKQRYFISILLASILLIYSFDYFSLQATGLEFYFFCAWIVFASLVIVGNAIGLLYKKNLTVPTREVAKEHYRSKSLREYGR
ncbi:hypothetical protein [Alkalihalobacillus pseudalcaliphilus]|uniref:hypothetical protein n=1 Tax=Alkalihalobacillus pseudalcaliphilus TaxID=79884 RepID=UPI00064DE567|nr:hypothetical protein [Alkalihalobacillus pseudalcaliphilus]KMK74545.1 hypothetical protein AB990_18740 [Alkalihalobacillus pseudalcaliphilus]